MAHRVFRERRVHVKDQAGPAYPLWWPACRSESPLAVTTTRVTTAVAARSLRRQLRPPRSASAAAHRRPRAFGPAGEKAANLAVRRDRTPRSRRPAPTSHVEAVRRPTRRREPTAGAVGAAQASDLRRRELPHRPVVARARRSRSAFGRRSREQVPLISPSATERRDHRPADDGFVYRTSPPDSLQGPTLADAIEEALRAPRAIGLDRRSQRRRTATGLATEFQTPGKAGGGIGDGVRLDIGALPTTTPRPMQIVSREPRRVRAHRLPGALEPVGPALTRTGDYDAANLRHRRTASRSTTGSRMPIPGTRSPACGGTAPVDARRLGHGQGVRRGCTRRRRSSRRTSTG